MVQFMCGLDITVWFTLCEAWGMLWLSLCGYIDIIVALFLWSFMDIIATIGNLQLLPNIDPIKFKNQ